MHDRLLGDAICTEEADEDDAQILQARAGRRNREPLILDSVILAGSLASLCAGMATGLGAIPVLFMRKPSDEQQNLLLGFAAGVMLAASFFSLILPAIEVARASGTSAMIASGQVAAAVLLGAFAIARLHDWIPPAEDIGLGPPGIAAGASVRRIWLFEAAITLHNFPEGMAVGVSFRGGGFQAGRDRIRLQNIPAHLAVAVALISVGYGRVYAALVAARSGLVEPIAGVIGVTIVYPRRARRIAGGGRVTTGLMEGLAVMMFLDTTFG